MKKQNPYVQSNGEYTHKIIARNVLGKDLPPKAVIHHADGNPKNNTKSNLVICQNAEYHALIHVRERALQACGNKHWRVCVYCSQYDSTENLRQPKRPYGYYHLKCSAENRRTNRRKKLTCT